MGTNKLMVSAAGSGKTTYLVQESLKIKDKNVLITTFTDANEEEIKKKFTFENHGIPGNVTVQTWYSFLIQHGVKPYQGGVFEERVNGLNLVSGRSAIGIREADTKNHYFDYNNRIYSDKISSFILKCNEKYNGEVINRISKIYPHIYIDEVQDLAGHDLDFLDQLFNSPSNVLLVGDPRQGTYSTNNSARYQKYARANIIDFFNLRAIKDKLRVDDTSLVINYRSNQKICEFSNKIFSGFTPANSGQNNATGHDGMFLVREQGIDAYFLEYPSCIQLRDKVTDNRVKSNHKALNFGISKGLSFDRVLIYPTSTIVSWIKDNSFNLAPKSRANFYVAVTRAKYSVGIVYNYTDGEVIDATEKYQPNTVTV